MHGGGGEKNIKSPGREKRISGKTKIGGKKHAQKEESATWRIEARVKENFHRFPIMGLDRLSDGGPAAGSRQPVPRPPPRPRCPSPHANQFVRKFSLATLARSTASHIVDCVHDDVITLASPQFFLPLERSSSHTAGFETEHRNPDIETRTAVVLFPPLFFLSFPSAGMGRRGQGTG